MTQHEEDLFTEALRQDLPGSGDESRLRARLVSAGVLAGAVVAPGAAVGAAAGAGGLSAKLVALPLALKVGATLALAGAVAVPLVSHVSEARRAEVKAASGAVVASRPLAAPPRGAAQPPGVNAVPVAAAPEPAAVVRMPAAVVAALEPVPQARDAARAAPVRAHGGDALAPRAPGAAALPSVASFTAEPAAAPAPVDEGSLRQETALMERALSALRRGDVVSARQALTEHASRFPNGHLVRERERALERTLGKETDHAAK